MQLAAQKDQMGFCCFIFPLWGQKIYFLAAFFSLSVKVQVERRKKVPFEYDGLFSVIEMQKSQKTKGRKVSFLFSSLFNPVF